MVTVAEWAMFSVGMAFVLAVVLFSTRHDDSHKMFMLRADYELKLEMQRNRNELQTR